MIRSRHFLALVSGVALLAPATASAQFPGFNRTPAQPAYNEGRERGERAGIEDARRDDAFSFTDESDYRRGDLGYRTQYGTRERYREVFRSGYEAGYRTGYNQESYQGPRGRGNGWGWGVGRGRGVGAGRGYYDVATQVGFNDGYTAGLDDGRDGRRFAPTAESRYRSADHEYDRDYGSRAAYQNNYRVGFRDGYQQGYAAGQRYRR